MNVVFKKAKFQKECNNIKLLQKQHGTNRAKIIGRRLDDLRAAKNLETMQKLPGRCHELKGNRKGQMSIDLDGPYRLIFEPIINPGADQDDWSEITCIKVLGVEDTHE